MNSNLTKLIKYLNTELNKEKYNPKQITDRIITFVNKNSKWQYIFLLTLKSMHIWNKKDLSYITKPWQSPYKRDVGTSESSISDGFDPFQKMSIWVQSIQILTNLFDSFHVFKKLLMLFLIISRLILSKQLWEL